MSVFDIRAFPKIKVGLLKMSVGLFGWGLFKIRITFRDQVQDFYFHGTLLIKIDVSLL